MSDHKLTLDVQKVALAIQTLRSQIDILEELVQEALIGENRNE